MIDLGDNIPAKALVVHVARLGDQVFLERGLSRVIVSNENERPT
jgi:hypothetical protein